MGANKILALDLCDEEAEKKKKKRISKVLSFCLENCMHRRDPRFYQLSLGRGDTTLTNSLKRALECGTVRWVQVSPLISER